MTAHLGQLAVAAAFAGLAAALAVRSPEVQQRAAFAARGSDARSPVGSWRWATRLLVGRPDAPPLGRRCAVTTVAAAAIALGVWRARQDLGQVAITCIPLLSLAATVGLGWMEPAGTRRRRHQLLLDAPQALELMASCLAAGQPLRAATAAVVAVYPGPLGDDLASVLRMVDLGVAETDAWRTLRGHPELGSAAVDLARTVDSGTMLVDALNHHGREARLRRQSALQVAARAVGVRSVLPLMTCFLPAFLLLGVVPSVVSAIVNALS